MASYRLEQQPFEADGPLPTVDDVNADPTWSADGIENWSSSSDDDEESVMEIDEVLPVISDIPRAAPSEVPSHTPKLSMHKGILASQKQWTEQNTKSGQTGVFPLQDRPRSTGDSDSSLEIIPAKRTSLSTNGLGKLETPVPLPFKVMAATGAGSSSQSAVGQTRTASVSSGTPVVKSNGATHVAGSSTSTPVPLPPALRLSSSTSHLRSNLSGSPAPVTKMPDLRQPPSDTETSKREANEAYRLLTQGDTLSPASLNVITAALARVTGPLALDLAADGRPYTVFRESNGEMVSTRGALIPAGYKLHDDPRCPYICPVRDCRRMMPNFISLGGHFGAGHKYGTFNDNGDGTLTQVGTYRNPSGSTPCIVVSRAPLSDDFPPPAEPQLAYSQLLASSANKRRLEADTSFDMMEIPRPKRNTGWTLGETPPTRPSPPVGTKLTDVVAYLRSIAHPDYREPDRVDIDSMIEMPRKRDLPIKFRIHHKGTHLDVQTYACAVAYCVGVELQSALACRQAKGMFAHLSERCIVPPLRPYEREAFSKTGRSCVGCAYLAHATDKASQCSLLNVDMSPKIGNGMLNTTKGPDGVPPNEASSKPAPRRAASDTLVPFEDVPLATRRPVRQSVLNRLQMDKENVGTRAGTEARSPIAQAESIPQSTVGNVQPGQFGTPDYEMEDWEIAPGRVTSEDSSRNVAYSGSFLTSAMPITMSPEICFNVLTIRPGQTVHVPVQNNKMQVFSVASGKVRVTTGGQVVQLGPNGAFPVRPGEKCTIENRIYFEAMVHCTTVKDYELE